MILLHISRNDLRVLKLIAQRVEDQILHYVQIIGPGLVADTSLREPATPNALASALVGSGGHHSRPTAAALEQTRKQMLWPALLVEVRLVCRFLFSRLHLGEQHLINDAQLRLLHNLPLILRVDP
ncbi:hypothetical protein AVM02_10635 [Brucella anthropi]